MKNSVDVGDGDGDGVRQRSRSRPRPRACIFFFLLTVLRSIDQQHQVDGFPLISTTTTTTKRNWKPSTTTSATTSASASASSLFSVQRRFSILRPSTLFLSSNSDDTDDENTISRISSVSRPLMSTAPLYTTLPASTSTSTSTVTVTVTPPPPPPTGLRRIAKVEQFARLPVWPVWMGVIIFLVSKTLGKESAAKLEDWVGGRVCPNFFENPQATSPFLMLVHHRHSFSPIDPIRFFQRRFILPEGFPAHPHRGFTTLTYFLKGGFDHRDSMGVAQKYGTGSPHHSQWLFTGAGLLHEEMFDLTQGSDQELYQLWVDVPANRKLDPPSVHLLGSLNECPVITTTSSETVILAGSAYGTNADATATATAATTPVMSDMTILHVRVDPDATWTYAGGLPSAYETVIVYVRQGFCTIAETELPVHHTAYLEAGGGNDMILVAGTEGVDVMILAGQPLRQTVAAQGSMVMTSSAEIEQAYRDYQLGYMGQPWDHALSEEEWQHHIQTYPCRYPYRRDSDSIR